MSEQHPHGEPTPPPPGWQPPPPAAPSYQPYPSAPAYPPQPHPGPPYAGQPFAIRAAHKPGAMPLRPLGLGDIYDAAFRIIRFNPRATVGSAALVAAVAMAFPVLITGVLTATMDLSLDAGSGTGTGSAFENLDGSSVAGLVGSFGSLGLGLLLAGIGTLLVTGMIAHVAAAAAIGRRLTLGAAWSATRGKRWRLVGLALLIFVAAFALFAAYAVAWVLVVVGSHESVPVIVVWGLVSVPVVIALTVWLWVRLAYLPVPVLMLEPVGVLGAVRRGFALTRRQFWRTLGIALLTGLVVGIASQVLGFPIGLIGQVASVAVPDRFTVLALVVTQALSQVVTVAFATPFSSAVTSLQYLDQRMRKEAYDVELMQQAGITA